MYKLFFSFTLLMIAATTSVAQNVEIKLNAPAKVNARQQFNVELSTNSQDIRLATPSFNGMRVLGSSQGYESRYYNGVQTSSFKVTFVVIADKPGKYTIPAVKGSLGGNIYQSNSVTIEVVEAGPNEDVYIDVTANKTEAYIGEQIVLTASLYSRYNLEGLEDAVYPNPNGFWAKDLPNSSNKRLEVVTKNGVSYLFGVLQKKLLFPQKTGTLTVEPYSLTCIIKGFGFPRVTAVSKPKNFKIKPLPVEGKPEDFGGAVGSYDVSISTDKTEVKLDEPVTLKITVTGSGNFQLFEAPKIDLPTALEKFEPKVNEDVKVTEKGQTGSKTYTVVAIARQSGEFKLQPVQFHYFDPASKTYKTAKSKELTITISGERTQSFTSGIVRPGTEVEDLGTDIRFIKQNGVQFVSGEYKFFNSFKFWMFFAFLIVLFGVALIVRQQQIKNNANVIGMKNRLAGKTSRKRLKLAETYIQQNKKDEFYAEVLNALWGYLSDKLAIPRAELSRDNVQEKLTDKQIDSAVVQKFIDTLDTCEFEHYAPESAAHPLNEVYAMAAEAIEQMETSIKA